MLRFSAAVGCMPRAPGAPIAAGQAAQYIGYALNPSTGKYESNGSDFECEPGGSIAARCIKMALRGELIPVNNEAKIACGFDVSPTAAPQKGKS